MLQTRETFAGNGKTKLQKQISIITPNKKIFMKDQQSFVTNDKDQNFKVGGEAT